MTVNSTAASCQIDYELLDSGGSEKLERFGERIIRRPSSICLWRPRRPDLWSRADATFLHSSTRGEEGRWSFRETPFKEWIVDLSAFRLKLRLQTNGQVGLFPEHASYLNRLGEILWSMDLPRPRVLNLFAYSGMATVFCAAAGAETCHVDLAKKALEWTTENLKLNQLESAPVRLICDDAIKFVEKEVRRGSRYDLVIADPPSFSRLSAKKSWKLEESLPEFFGSLAQVVRPGGALVLSCHVTGVYPQLLANLAGDLFRSDEDSGVASSVIHPALLSLTEASSGRVVPSGALVIISPALLSSR